MLNAGYSSMPEIQGPSSLGIIIRFISVLLPVLVGIILVKRITNKESNKKDLPE